MGKFIGKIKHFCDNILVSLAFGVKRTEEEIFTQQGISTDGGTSISQEVNENRVSKALLKGEVTQEVKNLRYRNYAVDREAKEYKYYAPTLAIRKDKLQEMMKKKGVEKTMDKSDNRFFSFYNPDELEVIIIQPNYPKVETVDETLEHVGERGNGTTYHINVERNFVPRFKIEEYCKKLAVFKLDNNSVRLEFYVSIYPNDQDFKSKGFVREVERIKKEGVRSDILDVNMVSFTSFNAYGSVDMREFEFKNLIFNGVYDFDGNYILRYHAVMSKDGYDLIEKYHSKEMEERYENKEKKDILLDPTGMDPIRTYICSECGKEIVYDVEEMDAMPINMPRDVNEEQTDDAHATEYFDAQIIEETYGKILCKDCLEKILKEKEKSQNHKINNTINPWIRNN